MHCPREAGVTGRAASTIGVRPGRVLSRVRPRRVLQTGRKEERCCRCISSWRVACSMTESVWELLVATDAIDDLVPEATPRASPGEGMRRPRSSSVARRPSPVARRPSASGDERALPDDVATRLVGPIARGERICEEGAVRGDRLTVNLDAVYAQGARRGRAMRSSPWLVERGCFRRRSPRGWRSSPTLAWLWLWRWCCGTRS